MALLQCVDALLADDASSSSDEEYRPTRRNCWLRLFAVCKPPRRPRFNERLLAFRNALTMAESTHETLRLGIPWRFLLKGSVCRGIGLPLRMLLLMDYAEHMVIHCGLPVWCAEPSSEPELSQGCARLFATCMEPHDLYRLLRLFAFHSRTHPRRLNDAPRLRAIMVAAVARALSRVHRDWRWEVWRIRVLLYDMMDMGMDVSLSVAREALACVGMSMGHAIQYSDLTFSMIWNDAHHRSRQRAARAVRILEIQRVLERKAMLPMDLQCMIAQRAGCRAETMDLAASIWEALGAARAAPWNLDLTQNLYRKLRTSAAGSIQGQFKPC